MYCPFNRHFKHTSYANLISRVSLLWFFYVRFFFFFFLLFLFFFFFFLKEGSINIILQNNEWKRNIRWNTEKLVRSRTSIENILLKSEIYVIIVEDISLKFE